MADDNGVRGNDNARLTTLRVVDFASVYIVRFSRGGFENVVKGAKRVWKVFGKSRRADVDVRKTDLCAVSDAVMGKCCVNYSLVPAAVSCGAKQTQGRPVAASMCSSWEYSEAGVAQAAVFSPLAHLKAIGCV